MDAHVTFADVPINYITDSFSVSKTQNHRTSPYVGDKGANTSYVSSTGKIISFKSMCLSDEVGTGDYFGPICVCASYVTDKDIEWLTKLGVNDSKTLSDEKIIQIAPELIKRIPYSQMSVDPLKYNSLIESGCEFPLNP